MANWNFAGSFSRICADAKNLCAASAFAAFLTIALPLSHAAAEIQELRLARQYGISHLQMALLEEFKLIEKNAAKMGLGDLKVSWRRFSDGPGMNEALLSGNIDIANGGLTALIVLFDKSHGNFVGLAPLSSMPAILMTRSPNVKSLRDLKENDRIALVSRVSMQAIILRMFAEKELGKGHANDFDHLTVPLPHVDAMTSLLSGVSEITGHFTAAPYYQQEEAAGMHRSLNSYDVLGGPATYSVTWTSKKFLAENPKTAAVFLAALNEATEIINKDPARAAQGYIKAEQSKLDPKLIETMIRDPENVFTQTPQHTMKFVDFMTASGTVKNPPARWQDLFPLMKDKPGS
jgi:NitT/TauT family transport system substrate-binding protein